MSVHRRSRRPSRRGRRLAAAVVLAGGLALAFAFAGITVQENALARDVARLHQQIAAEQAKQAQLKASAAEKQTADYVVERAKDFGFVWPWETLIAVEREAEAQARAVPADRRPPRVSRWIALFFGAP